MSLPYGNTGSLCSGFPPARPVGLPVKHPFAIALFRRLPIVVRVPLGASVTLLEATTPVKLPTKRCPPTKGVSDQTAEGPYFNSGSTDTGVPASKPPAYPTHPMPGRSTKLQ